MNTELYLAIAEAIKTHPDLLNGDKTPKVAHIDLWNQQVEFLEQEIAFPRPAVFVEFGETPWEKFTKATGGVGYRGRCPVTLHVVTDWKGGTFDGSPEQLEQLRSLSIADEIAPALEGLCGHGFDSMHRYSSIPNHNHEELVESIERYTVKLVQE